eukprot:gene9840-20464_t
MTFQLKWTNSSFIFYIFLLHLITLAAEKPNVIIILADDLGYGDLGWRPFFSEDLKHIETPELKKMASRGLIMTNFHAAAPICSPSRASIMVGLFPWRFGVDFIYAGDLKHDHTIELASEQLPLIPNIAMSFHHAGYYTAHIGKWHLGGQSHIDIPNRYNKRNCTELEVAVIPHIKNLILIIKPLPPPNKPEILTDRQTDEAMRVIREQVSNKKPFFLNLWYDAPHSPWEIIEPFDKKYSNKYTERQLKYATMISLIDKLNVAHNTLIVFTSDNGPEHGAGSGGERFKGRKRLLTEGGIRVPTIWQWSGYIPAGATTEKFGVGTDLFPTLLDAAGLTPPPQVRLDGMSLLPMLLNPTTVDKEGDERVVLWYSHCPGYPRLTAAWSYGFKLLWNDYEGRSGKNLPPPWRLFDMRSTSPNQIMEDIDILQLPNFRSFCQ